MFSVFFGILVCLFRTCFSLFAHATESSVVYTRNVFTAIRLERRAAFTSFLSFSFSTLACSKVSWTESTRVELSWTQQSRAAIVLSDRRLRLTSPNLPSGSRKIIILFGNLSQVTVSLTQELPFTHNPIRRRHLIFYTSFYRVIFFLEHPRFEVSNSAQKSFYFAESY